MTDELVGNLYTTVEESRIGAIEAQHNPASPLSPLIQQGQILENRKMISVITITIMKGIGWNVPIS